jgi:hypothetical protein
MTRPIGTVILKVEQGESSSNLKSLVDKAMALTPEGRVLSVVIPLPNKWSRQVPYEAITTKFVLGEPSERVEESAWMFSGNVSVRLCSVVDGEREISGELLVLMFRRAGEMAYRRRMTCNPGVITESELEVHHPAFTRDVANNVWHLAERNYFSTLRRRISMLHIWSDEGTLVVGRNSIKKFAYEAENLDSAVIGVPTKKNYSPTAWGQQVLFPT